MVGSIIYKIKQPTKADRTCWARGEFTSAACREGCTVALGAVALALGSAGLAQVCGVIRQGMAPHRPSSTVGRVKTRGELALRGVGELHQPGLGAPLGWVMLRVSRVKIYIPRDCMFVCVHLNTWHA